MKNSNLINQIQQDLKLLEKYWVLVYGSRLTNYYEPSRSDIDIVILSRKHQRHENLNFWNSFLGKINPSYDLRIFELLPLHIQYDIISHHQVVFGNKLDISEYLYYFYKLWRDVEYRVKMNRFHTISEKKKGLKRRNALLKRLIND